MKDVKVNINPTGFPSQFVSDAEKKSFDLKYNIDQQRIDTAIGKVVSGFKKEN